MKQTIDDKIHKDIRFTTDELHTLFPQISRALIQDIITELLGYKEICARWVPREHKENQMVVALKFLKTIDQEGDEFHNHIVTGDET